MIHRAIYIAALAVAMFGCDRPGPDDTMLSVSETPAPSAGPASCRLQRIATVEDRKVFQEESGAVFFVADADVNTDGAANSYHVDDFKGDSIASNTICNGINIRNAQGGLVANYRNCPLLYDWYARIKQNNWAPVGGTRIQWYGIATKNGQPCIRSDGFFTSQTASASDPAKDVCSVEHWIDANTIPSIVVPEAGAVGTLPGGSLSIAALLNRAGQVQSTHFAIVGDTGGSRIGEVSTLLAMRFKGRTELPHTYQQSKELSSAHAAYLILPSKRAPRPYKDAEIQSDGAAAFELWGGRAKFDACVVEARR
ncbi:hypothetical protein [Inquilinus sp. CA228]|uniref:hypothetical protein n=1 Tax=Inquilinus sp. CA228 TaxID=3455609 RepID=UPI003F8D6F6E